MNILDRIDKLCSERNWTYYELSKQSGITSNTIYKWKNGSQPTIANLEKICDAFGLSMKQFFAGVESSDLSDEQNEFLNYFVLLNSRQKAIIKLMLENFILDNHEHKN